MLYLTRRRSLFVRPFILIASLLAAAPMLAAQEPPPEDFSCEEACDRVGNAAFNAAIENGASLREAAAGGQAAEETCHFRFCS